MKEKKNEKSNTEFNYEDWQAKSWSLCLEISSLSVFPPVCSVICRWSSKLGSILWILTTCTSLAVSLTSVSLSRVSVAEIWTSAELVNANLFYSPDRKYQRKLEKECLLPTRITHLSLVVYNSVDTNSIWIIETRPPTVLLKSILTCFNFALMYCIFSYNLLTLSFYPFSKSDYKPGYEHRCNDQGSYTNYGENGIGLRDRIGKLLSEN